MAKTIGNSDLTFMSTVFNVKNKEGGEYQVLVNNLAFAIGGIRMQKACRADGENVSIESCVAVCTDDIVKQLMNDYELLNIAQE